MAENKPTKETTPIEQFEAQTGSISDLITPTETKTTGVPEGYSREKVFGGVSQPQRVSEIRYTTTGEPVFEPTATGEAQPLGLYDIYKQAGTILSQLDDVERKTVLNGLKSRGIGYTQNEKPGNGFTSSDRQAMSELLLQSNIYLTPWRETYQMLMTKVAPVAPTGPTRTYRFTPQADLEAVVQGAAQSLLGRNISAKDVARIGKYIQQAEVEAQKAAVSGGVVAATPSAESLAIKKVKEKYGEESENVKMMTFAELLNRAVSGRG